MFPLLSLASPLISKAKATPGVVVGHCPVPLKGGLAGVAGMICLGRGRGCLVCMRSSGWKTDSSKAAASTTESGTRTSRKSESDHEFSCSGGCGCRV